MNRGRVSCGSVRTLIEDRIVDSDVSLNRQGLEVYLC